MLIPISNYKKGEINLRPLTSNTIIVECTCMQFAMELVEH